MKKYKILIGILVMLVIGFTVYQAVNTDINLANVQQRAVEMYEWGNAQNQFATAGIVLWIIGIGTYLMRSVPSNIWRFIVKQSTVTLTLNNCDEIYTDFLNWYADTGRSKKSRTLVAHTNFPIDEDERTITLSSGYGLHFFMFDGRFFKFQREEKDAAQTKETKESITLITLGRTHKQFDDIIAEISKTNVAKDITTVYKWSFMGEYWRKNGDVIERKFDSVVLPKETKTQIVSHIDTFLDEREWYIDNGIPYRTGIILHGVPGTGKTSLVKGMCERFKKSLYVINLNTTSDEALEEAINSVPKNSIVLMEDIDTYSVTNTRGATGDSNEKKSHLTLSGLLNAIDGIYSSDGRIVVATTNKLEMLDAALVRKGRFNLSIDIGYLTPPCFREFFERFYPDFEVPSDTIFKDNMSPAELQALIIDHRKDPDYVFRESIK